MMSSLLVYNLKNQTCVPFAPEAKRERAGYLVCDVRYRKSKGCWPRSGNRRMLSKDMLVVKEV